MKRQSYITCPKCDGHGEIELTEPLQEVFRLIKDGRDTTTADILKRLPSVELSALCNRLTRLVNAGLVERTRQGKEYLYRPTAKITVPKSISK